MKKNLFLLTVAAVFFFSSCGSGNKTDKDKKDTVTNADSTKKGDVETESWALYKKYTADFQKAFDEKNVGKKFKINNLIVQFIQEGDDGSRKIDCLAYNPDGDSLTEGQATKPTKYKMNGKDLKPLEFGYTFSFKLADPKDAESLKKFDNNDMPNEAVYTYFNMVTIEGDMSEVGSNFLSFDKCKITDKK